MQKILVIVSLILMGIPAKAQTTLINALQLLQQKNYVSALDVCNSLLAETSGDPSVLGVRSQVYTAMGKYDLATQDADKAISIDNASDRAHYAKAEVLFAQKDYSQALQQYAAAITTNEQMTEAYAGKARALMNLQNYRDAMKVTEDALKTFPNDAELYFMRGLLNYQRGKLKYAVEDYDKALSINANWNSYQVFLNCGLANEALLKPDLAMQDYTRAILADPNNPGGYMARGSMQYSLAKYLEAAEDFKKAEILSPENSVITYNVGMAYYRGDDKASACRYFQKSCSQGNSNACKMVILNCSDRKIN
ncbi:MAG: tetratricopeptide repeat protein [Bacteroidales bacterium]|nr:tetratricopeptide repeat protein [Bacteroidales bacterium]